MSYIGDQLERLDLVVDDRKGTVLNPKVYNVGIQFFLDGKKTNNISIEDGTLNRIFRVLQDQESVVRSNRRRGLRRNPEKLKPRMIGDTEMRLIKLLAKKRGWTKYSAKRQSYNPYDIVIDGEGPGKRQFAGDLKLIAIRELLNWTKPEIAEMSDYPEMAMEGDWSGIRDSSDQAIDKIFEIFVLRRYG